MNSTLLQKTRISKTQDQCRFDLLRQFGDFTLAYGLLAQPVLQYFETRAGFIAYAQKWGYTFALGDPVAHCSDWPKLVDKFVRAFKRPTFVQASEQLATIVAENKKYYVNEMGYDTHLDLQTYDFSGKSKEKLRYAANWLKRRDYDLVELSGEQIPIEDINSVSEGWRGTRTVSRHEVQFLNRPMVAEHERDVRKFFLFDSAGKLVAFAFFDPLYRDGNIVGYTTAIKRRLPDAPIYAETGLTKTAIEIFINEGREIVTLGLAPLAGIKNGQFKANPLIAFSWKYGFNAWWINRFFYNLKGHSQFKNHFHGQRVQTYYCSPDLLNDLRVIAMLRLMRVL
jgi:lysylphosphatidylglycerol synthetase-like protein (DUF2156 family)